MLEQYWDFMRSPVVTIQQKLVEYQKPFAGLHCQVIEL